MMDLGRRAKFCSVAAVLLLVSQKAFAEEWWKDSFAAEGSAPCDNNDSIATFTDKAVEMWEVGCRLDKVQKINRLDVVILDMTVRMVRAQTKGGAVAQTGGQVLRYLSMRYYNDVRN